ncbi:MAG TPA: hypothetical protein DEB39_06220, partial [Planctomycetaceae bacterium]|nr:hypothetical protein [Planctomycetaceae bacterium]
RLLAGRMTESGIGRKPKRDIQYVTTSDIRPMWRNIVWSKMKVKTSAKNFFAHVVPARFANVSPSHIATGS